MPKTKTHKVVKGDTLEKIAKAHKIKDYKVLFDAPENAKLKKLRKTPKKIQPGDEVVIPSVLPGDVPVAQLKSMLGTIEKSMKFNAGMRKSILADQKALHARFKKTEADYKRAMTGLEVTETMIMVTMDLSKIAKIQGKIDKGLVSVAKGNVELAGAITGRGAKIMSPAIKAGVDKLRKSESAIVKYGAELVAAKQNLTSGTFIGSRLQVLVSSPFFKNIASGKVEAAKDEFIKAYNWDFGKELSEIAKRYDAEVAKEMAGFDALEKAEAETVALLKAKIKEAS